MAVKAKENKTKETKNKISKTGLTSLIGSIKENSASEKKEQIEPFVYDGVNSTVSHWNDTGNPAINYLFSKNTRKGVAEGRVIVFVGDSGTGKTAMCLNVAQHGDYDIVVAFLTETGAFEDSFIENFPKLKDKVFISQDISTAEDLFKQIDGLVEWKKKQENHEDLKILVILDSLANLTTEREVDGSSGFGGGRPLMVRSFFRTRKQIFSKHKFTFFMTTHFTKDVSVMMGDNRVITGGSIVEYVSSLLVEMQKDKDNTTYAKDTVLGVTETGMKLFIRKSRFGTNFMKLPIVMDVDKGFSKTTGLVKMLKDMEIIQSPSGTSDYFVVGYQTDGKKDYDRIFLDKNNDLKIKSGEINDIITKNEDLYEYLLDRIDKFNASDFMIRKKSEFNPEKAKKKEFVARILMFPNNKITEYNLNKKKLDELKELYFQLIDEAEDDENDKVSKEEMIGILLKNEKNKLTEDELKEFNELELQALADDLSK